MAAARRVWLPRCWPVMAEHCRVCALAAADLATLLRWRNHPSVRQAMFSQHEISPEEHQRWFEQASADPGRCLLLAETQQQALGFVHFSGVANGATAEWGFYAAPGAARGSGRLLGQAALDFGFGTLGLHKVCGHALRLNDASIRIFNRWSGRWRPGSRRRSYGWCLCWRSSVDAQAEGGWSMGTRTLISAKFRIAKHLHRRRCVWRSSQNAPMQTQAALALGLTRFMIASKGAFTPSQ